MTKRPLKNVAASVRQRLLNVAKSRGEELQPILIRFALERLLYRLGKSPHQDVLVLKGAFLFLAWGEAASRPTKDIYFLFFFEANESFLGHGRPEVRGISMIGKPPDQLQ